MIGFTEDRDDFSAEKDDFSYEKAERVNLKENVTYLSRSAEPGTVMRSLLMTCSVQGRVR
jgi:hypothetical protein